MGALVIIVVAIINIVVNSIALRHHLIKQSGGRRDSNNFGLIRVPAKIYSFQKLAMVHL